MTSTRELNRSEIRTASIKLSRCASEHTSNSACFSRSAAKLCTMRMPEKSSWINAFRFEFFFRWICHSLCARNWIRNIKNARTGSIRSVASASCQFFHSMITATPIRVSISGRSFVTLSESTSFRELTSPTTRARIFPVGLLSKKWKLRVWMCSYSCWRIVSRI